MGSLVEERRAVVSLGSQASAFASPRPGTDFIEQSHDLNSAAGLEILKLENVENYFSSVGVFPTDPEVKPPSSAEWAASYNNVCRPFVPMPAATGRLSNSSLPSVRPCADPSWITPFSAPMAVSPDPWSLSPTAAAAKPGYSLSPPTTNTQQKSEDLTMDRSVSSTTFIGEEVKDNRFEGMAPYYPYSVSTTSVAASYPHFPHYNTKSSFYQDRSKECYQCNASSYTTTLYKTNSGRTICESCSSHCPQYPVQSSSVRTTKNAKRRMAGGSKRQGTACNNCGTQKTTLWRRDATGQAVCNACGLYYKLHQQNRPPNMKKDTIQQRNRKPGRKNTKKKMEMDQMNGNSVSSSRYQDHMLSLQPPGLPAHMIIPGQMHVPTGKPDDMITSLYSSNQLIKQEFSPYTIGGSHHPIGGSHHAIGGSHHTIGGSHHMLPPPAPPTLALDSSTSQSIPPNITLNSLSPDTSSKDPSDLAFLNQGR